MVVGAGDITVGEFVGGATVGIDEGWIVGID